MKQWMAVLDQVEKHVGRGLDLENLEKPEFVKFLYSNNYYRFSGYARCFYAPNSERYADGATAMQIMDAYELDRRVRNVVLEGVSVVEPTLKSRVAYQVTKKIHGGDEYCGEEFYTPLPKSESNLSDEKWEKEAQTRNKVLAAFSEVPDSRERFIQHFVDRDQAIPLWAAIEVISLGAFSRFTRALRDQESLEPVAKSLGLADDEKHMLPQIVQNITFVRNISAHQRRLWNRKMDGWVALPKVALKAKRHGHYVAPNTPAGALTLLAGLVDQIEASDSYSSHLWDLIHEDENLALGYYQPIL